MNYIIEHLPKEQWKNKVLQTGYRSNLYYNVRTTRTDKGIYIDIERQESEVDIIKEYDNPIYQHKLYKEDRVGAKAYGIIENGDLIAAVEVLREEKENRLRITELWVMNSYQRKGLGKKLINYVRNIMDDMRTRALIVSLESNNCKAIDFYLEEEFHLFGVDMYSYSNNDMKKKEVKLEFGWMKE